MPSARGLIVPLGCWVRLNARDHTDLHVGVNISVLQLLQEDFVQQVGRSLPRALSPASSSWRSPNLYSKPLVEEEALAKLAS